MLPTTSLVVTTPSVRRSLISALTESESQLITVPVSRDSQYSTQQEVEQDQVLVPYSSRDSPSIMVRSQSLVLPSTLPPKSPPLSQSHTTPSSPPTPYSNIPMLLLCSIMKLSTISAVETSILRDPPIPILIDSLLRSSPH